MASTKAPTTKEDTSAEIEAIAQNSQKVISYSMEMRLLS
jgi:hypothetical protein